VGQRETNNRGDKLQIIIISHSRHGKSHLHAAAAWSRQEILEKLREWANEKLTTEEINYKLLLTTAGMGKAVFMQQQR